MSDDLINRFEVISNELGKLHQERKEASRAGLEIMNKVSILNKKRRGDTSYKDSQKLEIEHENLKRQQLRLKNKTDELRQKIFTLSAEETSIRARLIREPIATTQESPKASIEFYESILALRNRHAAFASDPTRVSSMRLMASQFVQELTAIINSSRQK